jgi:hypothetical protein
LICTQPLPSIFALYNEFGQSSGGTARLGWVDDEGGVGCDELIPKRRKLIKQRYHSTGE